MPDPFPHWQALDAMRNWCVKNGRPPREAEWARATLDRPAARTVRRRWGWYQLIADALGIGLDELLELGGQPGYRSQRPVIPHWRMNEALQAMIGHKDRTGQWPSRRSWEGATAEHPAARTYVRRLGSWALAVEAADRERRRRRGHAI